MILMCFSVANKKKQNVHSINSTQLISGNGPRLAIGNRPWPNDDGPDVSIRLTVRHTSNYASKRVPTITSINLNEYIYIKKSFRFAKGIK